MSKSYEAVVIGTSAGGMAALKTILSALPASFPLPIAIVQHIARESDSYMAVWLDRQCSIHVKEAEDKEFMAPGTAYIAPPGYHLLVEPDKSFSLSVDPNVNFSCPAIDVLFESAADIFKKRLIGAILTGANSDGSAGLKAIKDSGGLAIVQSPETAEVCAMPKAAIGTTSVDYIVDLEDFSATLLKLLF